MTVQYQLTAAEYRESLTAINDSLSRRRPTPWFYMAFVPFIALGIGMGIISGIIGADFQTILISSVIPSLSLTAAGLVINIVNQLQTGRRPSWRTIMGLGAMVLVVTELYLGSRFSPLFGAGSADPHPLLRQIMPHIVWVACVISLVVGVLFTRARGMRLAWDYYPAIKLLKSVEITAAGVLINDLVSRCEYQWATFTRFEETRNLFLLYLGPRSNLAIPKRALTTQEESSALRAMAELIPKIGAQAFPVAMLDAESSRPNMTG